MNDLTPIEVLQRGESNLSLALKSSLRLRTVRETLRKITGLTYFQGKDVDAQVALYNMGRIDALSILVYDEFLHYCHELGETLQPIESEPSIEKP